MVEFYSTKGIQRCASYPWENVQVYQVALLWHIHIQSNLVILQIRKKYIYTKITLEI